MSTLTQRSFSGGEIAPSLYARVDTAKYQTGLKTCRNFLVMRHGGASNRPGTAFVTEVKSSANLVRLIPFIFNSDQTYVLEFGNLYIRFIQNGAYVMSSGSPYEIASPFTSAELAQIKFVQSADVVTLVHPSHNAQELKRFATTNWTINDVVWNPQIDAPTHVGASGGPAGTQVFHYAVSAVAVDTYEESFPQGPDVSITCGTPTPSSPVTLTWWAVTNAIQYNVYRATNGVYGFVGTTGSTTFVDVGVSPDLSDTPPSRNVLPATGFSTVTYYQQRLMLANTTNDSEKTWASRTGRFKNFSTSSPIRDDDAISFRLAGRQVNQVRHLLDIGKLIVFTSAGEWAIEGDGSGILRPGEINPKPYSSNGSSTLAPLVVGNNALYVQARGSIVRDLGFDFQIDGYRGNDLTIFSAHLVDGYTITDWAYQQVPHSIVWAVRNDGVLLGLTYVREQQMLAWHRHDFDGVVESICVVPEGNEDAVYLVIRRTINGSQKRYIERMKQRRVDDIRTAVFADCALTYDGRNTSSGNSVTITGGSSWTYTEQLTLTTLASTFTSGDVGNAIHATGSDGTLIRFTITGYTNASQVTVQPHKTVPVAMRGVQTYNFTKAIKTVTGLSHLEGKKVSVLGDGYVVASPNNSSYVTVTVSGGSVTLDKPYGIITIGLPITADLQTLDIDTVNGATMIDKKKNIGKVTMHVESSRGIWAGAQPPSDDAVDPLENLAELKIRNDEDYDAPIALKTGEVEVIIQPNWNTNGRVFIRQIDPLPLSVLSISPSGFIPTRGF